MSAPSSSSSIPLRMEEPRAGVGWHRFLVRSFAVLAIGFTVASCAAPGAQRLERAPKGMPPSMRHLTADVLGFSLYATRFATADPESLEPAQRAAAARGDEVLAVLGDAESRSAWIGVHGGVAIRQLPSPSERGDVPDTRLVFADVRDGAALGDALEESGWSRSNRSVPEVNGDAPTLWTRRGDDDAAAVFDDAVYVAPSRSSLVRFLDAADAYAVPERKAMREYAAEAAAKAPMAAVFRFDLVRTQVRRPFQDDPALLEFARWATDSAVLIAFRDGWVGVADAAGGSADAVRVLGNVEWVPDLAPDIDWGAAKAELLDRAPGQASFAVALDGVGQHLTELVTGITRRNGQYATGQDVPESDDPLELQPVLDQLDGAAVVSWGNGQLGITSQGDGAAADDVNAAACRATAPLVATTGGEDLSVSAATDVEPCSDPSSVFHYRYVEAPRRAVLTKRAGTPPRPPILWLWSRSIAGCTGPAAGWVTFDGTGEMTISAHVALAPEHATGADHDCDLSSALPTE